MYLLNITYLSEVCHISEEHVLQSCQLLLWQDFVGQHLLYNVEAPVIQALGFRLGSKILYRYQIQDEKNPTEKYSLYITYSSC